MELLPNNIHSNNEWFAKFFIISIIVGPPVGGTVLSFVDFFIFGSKFPGATQLREFILVIFFFSYLVGFVPAILNAFLLFLIARPPNAPITRLLISPFSGALSTAVFFTNDLLRDGIDIFMHVTIISGSAASLSCTALMEYYRAPTAKRRTRLE